MAPPLAGSMKMRPWQFLRFDAGGAALYAATYIALGYVFREFLALITRSFIAASHLVEGVVVVAIVAYVIYRSWLYNKNAMYRIVPRVQVQELAQRLASDESEMPLSSMCGVTATTMPEQRALRVQSGSSQTTCRKKSSTSMTQDIYLYCT